MEYSLHQLINKDSLQKLCEKFSNLTKVVTAVLDLNGNILVATGWQDICVNFHRNAPATATRCKESDTILAKKLKAGEKYTVYKCKNGLVDVAVPIIIDGNHVGNLFTGQFLFAPPDKEYFIRQAHQFGFDESAYMDALSRVPVFTQKKIELAMDFLCELAQVIGNMGLNNLQTISANERLQKEMQERSVVQEKLRASEEKFRAMAETSPLAIYMSTGIEQKAEYMNPTFANLFGYTLKDIPSVESWWPLAYPDPTYRRQIEQEWQRRVEDALKNQAAIEPMEATVTCKDGSTKYISWGYINIGEQSWAFGLDLTELKQVEEELKQHRNNLEKLVNERTAELRKMINLMAGREIRMAELKKEIAKTRSELASRGKL